MGMGKRSGGVTPSRSLHRYPIDVAAPAVPALQRLREPALGHHLHIPNNSSAAGVSAAPVAWEREAIDSPPGNCLMHWPAAGLAVLINYL